MARLTPRKRHKKRYIKSPRTTCSSCDVYIIILSKSIPATVERVRYYRNKAYAYAVCPHCRNVIDRDYQNYCETCGQRLDWKMFDCETIIEEHIDGPENRRCFRKVYLKRKQRHSVVAELP